MSDVVRDRQSLIRARNYHEALIAHSADLILVIDAAGRLAEANPAAVALAGDRTGELISG